jgi:hypothetical protein
MSDPLGVSPDQLRRTADHLADTSAGMKKVVASLREALAASGTAWGDDKMGKQFAEGPDGYLAQMDWVNGLIDAKTDLLDGYSDSMRTTANTLEQQDNDAGGGVGGGASNGPAAIDLKQSGDHAALSPRLPATPPIPPTPSVPANGDPGPGDLGQTGGSVDGSASFVGASSSPFQSVPAVDGAGSVDFAQSGGQGQLLGQLGQLAPSLISAGGEVAGEIPGMFQQNQQPPTSGAGGEPPQPGTPDGDTGSGDGQLDPATSSDAKRDHPSGDDPDHHSTRQ